MTAYVMLGMASTFFQEIFMKYTTTPLIAIFSINLLACKFRDNNTSNTVSIFGNDDRKDVFEIKDKKIYDLTPSVGILMKSKSLNLCGGSICDQIVYKDGFLTQATEVKISYKKSLCADEKFSNQPMLGFCTAFLVAKNIVATAGHCLKEYSIDEFNVVFNIAYNSPESVDKDFFIKKQQNYKPVKVLENKYSEGKDFALILLDRPVEGINPIKFNDEKVKIGDTLFSIGYPRGLPSKVTDNASALRFDNEMLQANIDAFKGNSGSPVFDNKTYYLNGILTESPSINSYQYSKDKDCMQITRFRDEDKDVAAGIYLWENVMRNIPENVSKILKDQGLFPSEDLKSSTIQKGSVGKLKRSGALYVNAEFGESFGQMEKFNIVEVLDDKFKIAIVKNNLKDFPLLLVNVRAKSGPLKDKSGFVASLDLDWSE